MGATVLDDLDELLVENAGLKAENLGLKAENERLRAAFLGYVQPTNDCSETGKPCNADKEKCGCWVEMQNWIDVGWGDNEQIAGGE